MFDHHNAAGVAPDPQLQQLLRLNIDFLNLLGGAALPAPAGPSALPQFSLPAEQMQLLAQCDDNGLQRMSSCGFSLFSLSLHRVDLWQQAATRSQSRDTAHYGMDALKTDSGIAPAWIGFMECAVFFAWHLAQQHPQQARLLLGMSQDCMDLVMKMDLWQCRLIAQTHTRLLTPRWRHHAYFWSDLLRYGRSGEQEHFRFARLLGSQLMAQELEPSAILRLSTTD